MKAITKILVCIFSAASLLCGCAHNDEGSQASEELHLYDYEQTPLQLGIEETIASPTAAQYKPLNFSPQYAMWFTVNDYPDILMNQSEEEFTEEIEERFSNAAALGINTVYVHVRAYGDAYYKSELFSQGLYTPVDMDFDPLSIMIKAAHEHSLSIHAWINPLRCQSDTQMKAMGDGFTLKKWYSSDETNGTYLSLVNGRWWLCPAYSEVRSFIAEGAAEIVRNYDVDGIHIDDYFYPTTSIDYDDEAFEKSESTNLSEFRKEQCSLLVSEIYQAVKKESPEVLFGISPQGTLSGNDSQYADVEKWCSEEGYCDYIVPQIYFGLLNETAPFADMAALWKDMVTNEEIQLVIGICTYKMGAEDTYAGSGKDEWLTDYSVISKEVKLVRDMGLGAALYSYDSTFSPSEENASHMEKERSAIEALLQTQ